MTISSKKSTCCNSSTYKKKQLIKNTKTSVLICKECGCICNAAS